MLSCVINFRLPLTENPNMNTTVTLSYRLLWQGTFLLTRTNLNLCPTQGLHNNPSSLSGDEGQFSTSALFIDEKEGLMWLCHWHRCQCLSEEVFMSSILHLDCLNMKSYLPYSHPIMKGSTIEHHRLASRTITHFRLSCFSVFIWFPTRTALCTVMSRDTAGTLTVPMIAFHQMQSNSSCFQNLYLMY